MFAKLQEFLRNKRENKMYIVHGTRRIKHTTIWFLADIEGFTERELYVFIYFVGLKEKYITVLSEKNKLSGEVFQQKDVGQKAIDIMEREKVRKLYTSDDIKIQKGKPCGWIYGENKEVHDKKGNIIAIKQNACDFFGQKETIKSVDVAD
jgi:gamma-glutamylcyclotransferase (GGCT)/AIG2-like uncharacterized protein YtfP